MATDAATCSSAAVLGSRADVPARPSSSLVWSGLDEALVDHRQPAQDLLESHRLAHMSASVRLRPPPLHLMPRAAFIGRTG
jgi:hypothetical protein